uniref:Putative LOC100884056 [Megachile rotundata] n=1 Tax=Lepeophtheirus salmonis TaxID=72036 RepID=A0A0K2TXR4_LEPSM|nr:uncharacterized protein LOC121128329 [Lepeophtheirus salmonis]
MNVLVPQIIICIFCLCQLTQGGPTVYKLDKDGAAEPKLQAVWSTAIPLEELPQYKVGLGFGLVDKEEKLRQKKYNFGLITAKNKHRFFAPAGVRELTKEEFDNFASV